MPVFGACFLLALFAVMQRYKVCANEQKEMPAFIPFFETIYIMYARTFIISYLIYYYLLASPRSSMFFFLSHLAHILRICAQSVQPLANSQIMKPLKFPFLPLCKPLRLFLASYSSALFCSVFPCRLLGQIQASFPVSFPCSQLSTFLR